MSRLSRVPFLARLARRYAGRHKVQTARAVLGLLVATIVLTTGLGMGESIAVSLEEAALAQFGPIDIVLRSQRPFNASLADGLPASAGLQSVQGAASLQVTGIVIDARSGKAEAVASVRGVSAQEATTLGALRDREGAALAEPRSGEVVLDDRLARRLDARVGDRVTLRAMSPSGSEFETDFIQLVGASNAPDLAPATLQVEEDAIGIGAEISWGTDGGTVTLEATSPDGFAFANQSASSPLRLIVEPPIAPGAWTFRVLSDVPIVYAGGAGAAYLPGNLQAGATTIEATVSGIALTEGRAAITGRPVALVPLGDLQRALGVPAQATVAYYRAMGDPYRAVAAMENALPGDAADAIEIRAEKADRIADAQEAGAEITGFLLVMGGFTLLAAILLAFTLFSALVEERRAELGIARALGLTRGEVALSMTIEGALYAGLAALAGLALGLGLLFALLFGISSFAPEDAPRFAVHLSWPTLLAAFLLGSLLPLATIGFASLRFARLDPARAIRGIPDDPKGKRNLGLGFAAALALVGALLSFGEVGRLVGIPLALAGVATGLASLKRARLAAIPALLAIAHIVYTLYAFDDFPEQDGELDPIVTLARGAILALGLSALAVASAAPYARASALLRRDGRPRRASFVALKYLVSRRRPAGLTMAMVAIVVVVVTVMGTLFAVFSRTIPDEEAGYQIVAEGSVRVEDFPRALPADLRGEVERAEFLPRHIEFRQGNLTRDGQPIEMEFGTRQFLGVTQSFAEGNEYELAERAPGIASDRDAWLAVARGEGIIFPNFVMEEHGLRAGDRIMLDAAATGPREYVIAGSVRSNFVFQTWLPADHVRAMGFPQTTTVLVRVAGGADPNDVAHRLAAIYAQDGLTFTSIPEEAATISASIQALVLVFEGFLALGLFVGLAATGFLASRAVHERMRDIGTLRALGFEEADVRRAFMIESTLTTGIGLLIGTSVGLVVAHALFTRAIDDPTIAFRPPWLILALFAVAVLGLAALASRGPANRAAKLPPAIAVRYVE